MLPFFWSDRDGQTKKSPAKGGTFVYIKWVYRPRLFYSIGPTLYLLNFLRLCGYRISIAVSNPSAAIFLRMIRLCMRRTIYKTTQPMTAVAGNRISIVFIISNLLFITYTKIMPVKFSLTAFVPIVDLVMRSALITGKW